MALLINTEITTRDNHNVTGAYVVFDVYYSPSWEVTIRPKFYKSKIDYDNNSFPLQTHLAQVATVKRQLDLNLYSTVTNLIIHEYVKDKLEDELGVNTVNIVA